MVINLHASSDSAQCLTFISSIARSLILSLSTKVSIYERKQKYSLNEDVIWILKIVQIHLEFKSTEFGFKWIEMSTHFGNQCAIMSVRLSTIHKLSRTRISLRLHNNTPFHSPTILISDVCELNTFKLNVQSI